MSCWQRKVGSVASSRAPRPQFRNTDQVEGRATEHPQPVYLRQYCRTSDPTLFPAYFLLSPSLEWDDKLPLRSLESYFSSTQPLKTFVYVGRGDDYAGGEALAEFNKFVEILGKAP
jgi:hypothetical protein